MTKGEWIEVVTERLPNGEKRMWHYECSVCSTGEPPCPINKEHWDFCPNCGADMRGDDEEKDPWDYMDDIEREETREYLESLQDLAEWEGGKE